MTTAVTAIAAITAIIFVPRDHPLDHRFVEACMGHVARRGYRLFEILRDWDAVDARLGSGAAQVVVVATRTHRAGEVDRVEVVDEERTRVIRQRNSAVGRRWVADSPTPLNIPQFGDSDASLRVEVAAYRSGYADGYVDCATVKSNAAKPPPWT